MIPTSNPSPRPGRNDPCPCRSGKKYKLCCGLVAPAQVPVPAPSSRGVAPLPGSIGAGPADHAALATALRDFQAGQYPRAESTLRSLLARQPDNANALHLLGLVAHQAGAAEPAEGLLRRAVAIAPRSTIFLCNLATVLIARSKHAEAAACHERAVSLQPRDPTALNGLGVSRLGQLRYPEARDCFAQVLRLAPNHALALYNLGVLEHKCGQPAQAIVHFERSLALQPGHAQAHNDWGSALRSLGRIDAAVAQFEQATQLKPDFADAHYNLGTVLLEQSRLAEALASLQRSQALRWELRTALRMATAMPVIHASVAAIAADRDRFARDLETVMATEATLDDPLEAGLGPSFFLAYHGLNNRALQERLAAVYLKLCPALAWQAPAATAERAAGSKRRVGFLSNYLHDHTVGDVMHGLIEQLDADRFDVTVLRFRAPQDAVSQRIDAAAGRVVVLDRSLAQARLQVAELGLDVLVFPEIGMDAATYFLAFSRLAPVQCVMWGHPDTTGIANVDYYVSAADAEPDEAQDAYSEKLVRLGTLSTYYHRPKPEPPESGAWFDALALPPNSHLYLCPQTLYKFHPDFDAVMAAVLRRDPAGIVVLFHGRARHWSELLMQRFARTFGDVAPRIRFLDRLPRRDYFALLRRADVVLDTLHFGGGNTSYQALGLGVPVVTWCGAFARGRFTYALYKQMGMTDLVATTPEAYVELACRLVNDPSYRAEIVERIQRLSPALFENLDAVRELEHFFESVLPLPEATSDASSD